MTQTTSTKNPTDMAPHEQRAAFEHALADLKVELSPYAFEKAFARVRRVTDNPGDVPQEQLRFIVDDVVSGAEVLQGVAESFR